LLVVKAGCGLEGPDPRVVFHPDRRHESRICGRPAAGQLTNWQRRTSPADPSAPATWEYPLRQTVDKISGDAWRSSRATTAETHALLVHRENLARFTLDDASSVFGVDADLYCNSKRIVFM